MNASDLKSPADIKDMSKKQLDYLASELRDILVDNPVTGHASPNLGIVGTTIAMHHVFDAPTDKIVLDVSGQTYAHEMLTGRIKTFLDSRTQDDSATDRTENPYDEFRVSYTSTGASLAAGLALSRDLRGGTERVTALLDASILDDNPTVEGLDFGARLKSNFIVLVNDNGKATPKRSGGLIENLSRLRETGGACPVNHFHSLGYEYIYLTTEGDVSSLTDTLERIKDTDHPVVVHIHTMEARKHDHAPRLTSRQYGYPYISVFVPWLRDACACLTSRDPISGTGQTLLPTKVTALRQHAIPVRPAS